MGETLKVDTYRTRLSITPHGWDETAIDADVIWDGGGIRVYAVSGGFDLSRDGVLGLIRHLQQFVDTGYFANSETEETT